MLQALQRRVEGEDGREGETGDEGKDLGRVGTRASEKGKEEEYVRGGQRWMEVDRGG